MLFREGVTMALISQMMVRYFSYSSLIFPGNNGPNPAVSYATKVSVLGMLFNPSWIQTPSLTRTGWALGFVLSDMLHQISRGSPGNVNQKYTRCSNLIKSLWRMWSGIALGLSRFLGHFIQGFMVPPEDSSFGGGKRLHVAWNGGVRAHRAAVPFPLEDRHKVLSLPLVGEFEGQRSSSWRCICGFPLVSSCRRRLNGLWGPKSGSQKGLTIPLLPEITQMSLLLCRFLLCQHTRNSIILCNMVQRFGKIKISFLIWGQSLVPSITANRDLLHSPLTSRKLLMKKSIYSAWIMGTGIWLLLTQAWQLCRCYNVQYYFKVSIFISNKMLTF